MPALSDIRLPLMVWRMEPITWNISIRGLSMRQTEVDRRTRDRRRARGGGRRLSDSPPGAASSPACPNCRKTGVALQAGEAEGGWWFVCSDCDHMWDQRALTSEDKAGED